MVSKGENSVHPRPATRGGGFGGFVRTPLFANPPPKNTTPHLPNCLSDIEVQAWPSRLYLLRLSIHNRHIGALF